MGNFLLRLINKLASTFSRRHDNDFFVDGTGYRIISYSKQRVVVSPHHLYVRRSLQVPSEVHYGGKTYTVWGLSRKAFAYSRLQQVSLPETVAQVEESAFLGCHYLTQVSLPASINAIRSDAFHDCTSLTVLRLAATEPPTINYLAFDRDTPPAVRLEVPQESLELYSNAECWKDFGTIVPLQNASK